MSSQTPLTGLELIDCAKANATQGPIVAADLCGYAGNVVEFAETLREACREIGVEIAELGDLITGQQVVRQSGGIEIAPDTPSDL